MSENARDMAPPDQRLAAAFLDYISSVDGYLSKDKAIPGRPSHCATCGLSHKPDHHGRPLRPGDLQYDEMRKAFYAGAVVAFANYARIGRDDVTEEDAIATLEGMAKEFDDYTDELRMETEGPGTNRPQ